jgi:hypothetical protein
MPRTGRGGSRQGQPGKSYSNRTDLNSNKQAVTVAPNQTYGEGAAQARAQQAVPLPKAGGLPSLGSGSGSPPAPVPPGPVPGALGPLNRPTERPGEPITAGLPMGPGAGPEALSAPRDFDAEDLVALKPLMPSLLALADLPGATNATRNFVRRLRGAMPIEETNGVS